MQNTNSIQNATINTNAAVITCGLVVGSANAHRAYPHFDPRDFKPQSKRPSMQSCSVSVPVVVSERLGGIGSSELGLLLKGSVGTSWRHDHQQMQMQMPSTMWATFVLNRQLCG